MLICQSKHEEMKGDKEDFQNRFSVVKMTLCVTETKLRIAVHFMRKIVILMTIKRNNRKSNTSPNMAT